MPATVVTLTIAEADLPAVVKAVCLRANVPIANANAKAALVAIIKGWVDQERKAEAAQPPATIE